MTASFRQFFVRNEILWSLMQMMMLMIKAT